MLIFPSTPNHVRHPPQGLDELRKSTFFFGGKNSTNWLFSNLSPRFWCMTSFTSPGRISLSEIFILTSLNDTSSPCAREHLRSCLHLTNQCAKRKVLSLTKPKGKIYKTKSLDHYITIRPPPMSVLYMMLKCLMVRFQQCWSFGECGAPLHCHCSQVHSGPAG